MKPPAAAPSLRLRIDQSGKVAGTWLGSRAALPAKRLAMVLDGTMHAAVDLVPNRQGASFEYGLPNHLICGELDVLGLPDGGSLLGLPFTLSEAYRLEMGALSVAGGTVSGSFQAAQWLADEIGVELLDGSVIAAQTAAYRLPDRPGTWHFKLQLAALLRPAKTLRVQPRVGSRVLSGPVLTLTPADLGFVGCLDGATLERVEGWAIDLAQPTRRVALEVLIDGRVVARVTADEARPDIQEGGLGDGLCGFGVDLPPVGGPPGRRRVSVRLRGKLTELSGSPAVVDTSPGMLGSFDTLHGVSLHGWAMDHRRPGQALTVEAVGPGGEVLGSALANRFRGDLLNAGLNAGLCAFKIDIGAHFERLLGQDVLVRVAGAGMILSGSPKRIAPNNNIQRFLRRKTSLKAGVLPRLRRALNHRAGKAAITFIMPVHNPTRQWLVQALESVRTQFCDRWELICVDDGSTEPYVSEVLSLYAARDKRIRVLTSRENVGIARAINFGLRAARYDYVAFVDHDDYVEPDAAWQLIRAAALSGADLIYSDEALTDENLSSVFEVRLRPAFSHDYYLSHPYFVHLICVRTDIARRIGGWDEGMAISADVDFVLRVLEASEKVAHVPAVLYRWRTHGASTGHAKQADVMRATVTALQRHLDRLGTGGQASEGVWFNQFRIDWPKSDGLILVVIPTKNGCSLLRTAIESIERTSIGTQYRIVVIDHESDDADACRYLAEIAPRHIVMPYHGEFNFSRMNNQAVFRHGADAQFVLFLNNDVEATQTGWMDRLRALANRPDVGAVGPLLMYVDRRVQHAGVILGFNNSADHALKFQEVFLDEEGRRNLGYNCALSSVREYSAVTAACVMLRKSVFDEVQGFDEDFAVGFNDTDLCLRIRRAGYKILYDGHTMLYHYESATRSQTLQVLHPEDTTRMVARWSAELLGGDPFYHPNLSLKTQDHVLREDEDCRPTSRPRVTRLQLRQIAEQAE